MKQFLPRKKTSLLPIGNDKALRESVFRLPQKVLKLALRDYLKHKKRSAVFQNGFLYSKGTIPVLLVAHLDTVHKSLPSVICRNEGDDIWMSPEGIGGDDRCGVYIILRLLDRFDCHVLFTEDEEIGGIGAEKFASYARGKDFRLRYILEFDRRGKDDAVFYNCDNKDFTRYISSFGFKEADGSFSDISVIAPVLKTAAVNLSSGYHAPHTQHEYVSFAEIESVIDKAGKILKVIESVRHFDYVPRIVKLNQSIKPGYSLYGDSFYGDCWYDAFDPFDGMPDCELPELPKEEKEDILSRFSTFLDANASYDVYPESLEHFDGCVFDGKEYTENGFADVYAIDGSGTAYELLGSYLGFDVYLRRPDLTPLDITYSQPVFHPYNAEDAYVIDKITG